MKQEIERIRSLPSAVRFAGYIARSAKLAEIGAELNQCDHRYTEDEVRWEKAEAELEPWIKAMSSDELKILEGLDVTLATLTRGINPFVSDFVL